MSLFYRLLETRREQLILIFLGGEIPKSKRPKTLNFLMKTKTYIVWPAQGDKAEKKSFWVRLKKAIISNNWDQVKERKSPKAPRPSIS